jgi:hypothetical protein
LSTISGIPSIGCSMQENVCMDVFYSVVKDQYMTGMKHPVAFSSQRGHLLVPSSVMSDWQYIHDLFWKTCLSTPAKSQPCISISQYRRILRIR